ncbi:hypothetical protein [Klebsiella sp. CVUAS 10975.2]|uniref:hypothetical protein n=1 Tax=Klebsiella sp. CVUAS 10975.2 TaxID=2109904 RepID=UPI001C7FD71A|nr:hypothetical protein [Klebsiella sp. CVUAS 10975.2]MBX4738273.1 hypothetical protein [Klebsiella sp. CVUAS 10975.2]
MNIETVNELIASLESAGELSIREQKFLKLAKAHVQLAAENVALRNSSSHVLQSGEPPKTYREEWFIARVKGRGFAVLRSLPEEYSYDYTTLDATYFRKDLILEWMQLPNSEFLPNVKTPATDRIVAGIKADGVEEFAAKLRIPGDDQFFDALAKGVALAADDFAKQLREGADK